MANPTDDDRALARSYMSWPDTADRLAHTFAVIREEGQQASAAALAAEVERAVLERLLTELAEMRQRYRGNPYLAERVQWAADWLRDKRAELAQGESNG